MSKKSGQQDSYQMRKAAEAELARRAPIMAVPSRPVEEVLHELRTYQVELEMQNEALRQSQIELEEARNRFMDLYDFAPVGYLTLTPEAIISEINLTGANLLGEGRKRLLDCHFGQSVAPEDSDRWHSYFLDVLKKNGTYSCELALQRGDGSRFYARLDCMCIRAGGNPKAVRVALTDVSERNRAEIMLYESEEKLHAVFESVLDGILIADTETRRFATGNPAICRMLGYSPEELSRIGVADIHPRQDLPHIIELFEKQLHGEQNLIADIPVKRKDGSVFYVDINAAPVSFGGKNYLVGIFRDITERKQIETELKEYQQLLRELAAQGVASREAECKHIAREVHDELGQLLTALRMDISLLRIQFGKHDPALMKKVKDILALVDKAIVGVRNVAFNLRPAVLDMGVVPAIAWLCDKFPNRTDTACTLRVVDNPVGLDDARTAAIFRIVQESLTNVARYAAANSVEITIGKHGDDAAVEVRDDGKGFDLAALPANKAFGLMGMRERAMALGGKVEITSAPSKGTVVSVRIPIKPREHIL